LSGRIFGDVGDLRARRCIWVVCAQLSHWLLLRRRLAFVGQMSLHRPSDNPHRD
jgi:hypothetical protein